MVKSGEFVVPGIELGYAEEYIAGEGAYEEDGMVYAAITGTYEVDQKERKIVVHPKTSTPPLPKKGDVVLGTINDIKSQMAILSIHKIQGNERPLPEDFRGSIHISQTRDTYVSDLGREFQTGDIVVARILNVDRVPIQLSTVDRAHGVLKAYCTHCNTPLVRKGDRLECKSCGRLEDRKLSTEYGKGQF
jgi:exosome complex component CSL4